MKPKNYFCAIAIIFIITQHAATAQTNIFPSTGNAGIGTLTPVTPLQVIGSSRFGGNTNYAQFDNSGNLTFNGTSSYKVGSNKYAFQFAPIPNYGLFFNSTDKHYEFRNSLAAPVFYIGADSGQGIFSAGVTVGSSALPPTNGLYVSGKAGIGTTSPDVKLHVTGGNAVTLAGGGTIVAGLISSENLAIDKNEIQTRNNGAANTLHLNKHGGNVNLANNSLVIKDSTGFVGIGTTSPKARLHVTGGTDVTLGGGGTIVAGPFDDYNLAIDNNEIQARNNGASATLSLNAEGGLVQTGRDLSVPGTIFLGNDASFTSGNYRVITDGNIVPNFDGGWELGTSLANWMDVWATDGTINTSDERDKTNIKDLNYGLKEIMKLRSVRFNWKNKINDADKLGLIAQDLQKVLPEVVRDFDYKINEQTGKTEKVPSARLGVMYADVIPVIIKGMQQQQQMIEEQNKKNTEQQEIIEQQNKKTTEQQEMIEEQNKKIEALTQLISKFTNDQTTANTQTETNAKSVIVTDASLEQNAPNPFNQTTTINYYLPTNAGNASINITDMNGRVVKTVAVTTKGKGQLVLQAGMLIAGTYYYSLIINGKLIDTKKMVLIK